ncbi:hypothetical protein TNCV_3838661 [Trichonephila clavipes]|nr:hypothetical protein TNCV_3838661 [Trichonephila clavipes]
MATGSYLTPIYSRSQSEVLGDHHRLSPGLEWKEDERRFLLCFVPENRQNQKEHDTRLVAAIRDISRSCLDPNDFTLLNCIVKGHASLSPPSLRLHLCSLTKLKLDDRGRRRQGRLFPEGWEKEINHDVMTDLIKRSPRQNGEGGRTPKHETLYRSRAPAGRGEERRKDRGTAEGSESKVVIYHPRTQSKGRSAVQLNHVVKSVKRVLFVELWGRSGFLHFVEEYEYLILG